VIIGSTRCVVHLWWVAVFTVVAVCPVLAGFPTKVQNKALSSEEPQCGVTLATSHGSRNAHASRLIVRTRLASQPKLLAQKQAEGQLLKSVGERLVRRYNAIPGVLVLEPEDVQKQQAGLSDTEKAVALQLRIKALRKSELFEFVEPDWVVRVQATPADAAFADGRLWGLRNPGPPSGTAGADIGAVSAWDITTGDTNVIVGIIDTGIRYTHQDLAPNMWHNPGETAGDVGVDDDGNGFIDDVYGINAITGTGNPMDDNSHGSHCAGTIGAVANGGGDHVGVAWQVSLMALKFLASDGSGYSSDAITCIDYAIDKGVDILSNSWGGGGYSLAMAAAIERARAAGILFVAAAGNEGNNNDLTGSYPANYTSDNVISVAALDRNDQLASFSNYGASTVDLGAPGVDIYSCVASSDSAYDTYSGTSMATPHVAGVAALLVAQNSAISLTELRQRLLSTVVPVSALSGRCVTEGRVNAANALTGAADGTLEVAISAAENPLAAEASTAFYVSVSDFSPVLSATVSGGFEGYSTVVFRDDGLAPDETGSDGIYSASITVPTISGNVDIVVDVDASGKTPATARQTFSVVGRPANDDFADRITVSPGLTMMTGVNHTSTLESGEPRYTSGAGSQTVWWRWTAPETVAVTLSTLGSDFDTILAIYTGSTLGSLTLVSGNDDSGGLQSSVSFTAQAGVTYAIQVNGYGTAVGTIQLNLPAQAGAPNIIDEPDDVRVLVGNAFSLMVGAEGGAPFTYQWYRDAGVLPGATSSTYVVAIAALVDEGTYQVVVSNAVGGAVSREAFVAVERVDLQPDNDGFTSAYLLSGTSGRVQGSTALATGETGEPNHADVASPLASIWYSWTASANGRLNVNTFGSDFDTVLAVYVGSAVNALTLIDSNDDASSLQSEVEFNVAAGTTYRIVVDGYSGNFGSVTLDYSATTDTAPVMILLSDSDEAFSAPGGAYAFTVNANVNWVATASASWVQITSGSVGASSGTVEYMIPDYSSGMASRTATITISGGGASRTYTITQVPRIAWADYAANGASDLAVFDPADGNWFVRDVAGATPLYDVNWGWSNVEAVSGDYDGDGIADLAIFDQATGRWFIRTIRGEILAWNVNWGWPGVQPVAGDYDGDGIDDLAIFDQLTGRWFIRTISGDILAWSVFWGWPGVQPVAGDYDADGVYDLAVLDQNTGRWFVRNLAGDILVWEIYWGWAGVTGVSGDFDGDKQADFAVFDSLSARWFIRTLGGDILGWNINWGWPGVTPVSGDYDGDGVSDLAIYDKASGAWYIRAMSGTPIVSGTLWGVGAMVPVAR